MKLLKLLALSAVIVLLVVGATNVAQANRIMSGSKAGETFQGKGVMWWAKHAVQARKDANKRAFTIKRLRRTLNHSVTIAETVKLATIVFPAFTEHRAWCIIRHESWDGTQASLLNGKPARARNRNPWPPGSSEHATGLYQFLPSTFHSTPFGRFSIYSPMAQSLAAGWMHQHGRAREWAINC